MKYLIMRRTWIACASFLIFLPLTVWSKPVIFPGGVHISIPKRGKLELRCHDNTTSSGAPFLLRWQREKTRRLEGEVAEGRTASLRLSGAQVSHMGWYMCVNNNTLEHSSIYVYVKDPSNAFQQSMMSNVLVRAGEDCVIPCLVTDPEIANLTLETCDGRPLPSGMVYSGSLQRGIIISNARMEFEGCYRCVGQLGGNKVKSGSYTVGVRLVPEFPPVISLSQKDTVILKTGETFRLNCSSSNANSDLSLSWDFPPAARPGESHNSRILPSSQGYLRSTLLYIAAVNQSDSGVYRCHAHNEKGQSDTAVQLDILDHGFITVLGLPGPIQADIKEGESLTLRVEFEAYPAPRSISWSFNGKHIVNTTEHFMTVHRHKYRLTVLKSATIL